MSTTEILEEFRKLTPEERRHLFEQLSDLHEQDVVNGLGPTEEEKKLLDQAWEEYQQDMNPGQPWREALHELGLTVKPE